MGCQVEIEGDTIRLRGEMTIYSASSLKQDLFAAIGSGVSSSGPLCRVDLSQVSEFDTTGLQMLLMVTRPSAADGRQVALVNPSAAVRDAVNCLRIDDSFWVSAPTGEMT